MKVDAKLGRREWGKFNSREKGESEKGERGSEEGDRGSEEGKEEVKMISHLGSKYVWYISHETVMVHFIMCVYKNRILY